MSWPLIILTVSIALPIAVRLVLAWLVVPIRIRANQRMPIEPHFVSAAAEHFTPEMRDTLHALIPEFQAEGFADPAGVCHGNASPGLRSVQTTLINRATGDVAVILTATVGALRSTAIAVRSEFPDGRGVVTGSNRTLGIFPRDPNLDAANFPRVRDARTLCEIHRRRLARLGNTHAPRVAPAPPGDEIAAVTRDWHREFARHVGNGYYVADTAAGIYRHTWKGAFFGTWKQLQPIKGLRLHLRDRRARRLLRELGMETWTPPATAYPPTGAPIPVAAIATDPVTADPAQSGALRYETGLAADEVRIESAGPDALTVRMGRPTVPRYLLSRWRTLLAIGIWSLLLSFNLYVYWLMQARMARVGGGGGARPTWIGLPTLIMGAFLVNDVVRLILAVLQVRGTIVITASRHGLTFRNVPAFDHAGFIPRDDVEGLGVAVQKSGFRKTAYVLYANYATGKRRTLLVGRDLAPLHEARARLATALGIESPQDRWVGA